MVRVGGRTLAVAPAPKPHWVLNGRREERALGIEEEDGLGEPLRSERAKGRRWPRLLLKRAERKPPPKAERALTGKAPEWAENKDALRVKGTGCGRARRLRAPWRCRRGRRPTRPARGMV